MGLDKDCFQHHEALVLCKRNKKTLNTLESRPITRVSTSPALSDLALQFQIGCGPSCLILAFVKEKRTSVMPPRIATCSRNTPSSPVPCVFVCVVLCNPISVAFHCVSVNSHRVPSRSRPRGTTLCSHAWRAPVHFRSTIPN